MPANAPPPRMDFITALAWCDVGWHIRRAHWIVTDALPSQETTPTDEALVWLRAEPRDGQARPGVYYYRGDDADAIVVATILTRADMEAKDWTCEPAGGDGGSTDTSLTNPNAGRVTPPPVDGIDPVGGTGGGAGRDDLSGGDEAGGSAGGSASSSGGGGGGSIGAPGGSGGGANTAGGGGDGGDGGSGGGGALKKTTGRANPSLTITNMTRNSSGCASLQDSFTRWDTFTFDVNLSDPAYKPGEIYFLDVWQGSTLLFHGTIVSGQTRGMSCDIQGTHGAIFTITARAYLPLTVPSWTFYATAQAKILGYCYSCPAGAQGFNYGDHGAACYYDAEPDGVTGFNYAGPSKFPGAPTEPAGYGPNYTNTPPNW